jgi:hypothetical protein
MPFDRCGSGLELSPLRVAIAALLLTLYAALVAFWVLIPERELLDFMTREDLLELIAASGPTSYLRPALRSSLHGFTWAAHFVVGSLGCFAGLFGALFLRDETLRFLFSGIAAWTWLWFGFVHAICIVT